MNPLRFGRFLLFMSPVFSFLAVMTGGGLTAAPLPTSGAVKKQFANPSRDYATAPLWVWNDWLTEKQVRDTMRDLAAQGVKQVFVHPRPGLMTPYLSADWFRLWKVALHEAGRLDMNVWIYDENSYPSGFAGGWVPELMPESRGQGLHLRETNQPPKWDDQTLRVFRWSEPADVADVTELVRSGAALAPGRYLVARIERAGHSPWHGGRWYVNLLTPGVTEKFLEVTLGAYEREIGAHFGKRVPGVFTDEPEIRPAGGLPWCNDLPAQFRQRRGYDLLEQLPALVQPVGDWRRVRHDFFRTLNELFIERWAQPYYEFCARRGLEFTGHYWEHEWPNCTLVPDNLALAAWQQRPGIDILMNQYAEHTHAQFGNVRSCREIASIANQLGRPRTLVELYGAGGWDLRFEDMKRIADWLLVLGVNTLDEHLSYVTIRGARKNDHPQSFSYHTPWWPAYHVLARYFSRLSAAVSQGQQVHRILVLEPTTTAWMYQGDRARLEALGDAFMRLLLALEAAQIEYDLGSEDVIARWGSVKQGRLWVGQRAYDVIVLPPGMENVSGPVTDLGEEFLTTGGSIVCLGDPPARVDGRESSRPAEGAGEPGWITARPEEAPAQLRRWNDEEQFRIERATGDRGILFHHRRRLADGQLLFLVNTSIEHPSAGRFITALRGVEEWDATTGRVRPYPFRAEEGKVTAEFALPPCGSLLLFLSEKPSRPAPLRAETTTRLEAVGPMAVRRLEPNVLKLDYVDITAGGETRSNVYYYAAAQFAFQKNGLERNPWDHAVQFQDEIISRTFAADSGFTASYRFTIESPVPTNLTLVIERPDLYTITVNGRPVAAPPVANAESARVAGRVVGRTVEFRDWWLDRAFGRMPIAEVAQPGENVVTLSARPFTVWHELEAAFVLGDFTLKPVERGFVITADAPLGVASSGARQGWNAQGHPFYAGRVGYRQSFRVAKPSGRYVVTLPDWWGSVAEVRVNGQSAGYILSAPWECEVTRHVRAGLNEVEVQVIGTLKNTLGPHHGKPPLGSAWPAMFRTGPENGPPPGASYHTVGYGLFAPFALTQITSAAQSGR